VINLELTHVVSCAANWLGGALRTIAEANSGDGGALYTSLSSNAADDSANSGVEEV